MTRHAPAPARQLLAALLPLGVVAVLVVAWIAGLRAGLVFLVTGVLFSALHERLRRARRRAEAALRASEQKYARLIAIAPDAIVAVDEDQRVTVFNQAAERIFGWSRDEILGQPLALLLPARLRENHVRHVAAFARAADPVRPMHERGVVAGLRRSGDEFPAEAGIARLDLDDGRLYTVVVRDITHRRQLERDAAEARRLLQSVLDSATEVALVAEDLDGRIQLWSEGARRLYGWEAAEVIGEEGEIQDPGASDAAGTERLAALRARALDSGRAEARVERRRKDGSTFQAHVVLTRRQDAAGQVIGVLEMTRDVSHEQRYVDAQELLADAGELLGSTLDMPEMLRQVGQLVTGTIADFCVIDLVDHEEIRRAIVVHADPALAEAAASLERSSPARDRPNPVSEALERRETRLISVVPSELLDAVASSDDERRALAALRPGSAIVAPIVVRGQPIGTLTTGSSHAGRYQEADVPIVEELADRLAQALDNARLYREAQEAAAAREQVLAVVAHDLRNPLNAIQLQAALLARRHGPERRKHEPVRAIERSARRMNRLIEDLLDIARLEAGRFGLARAALSPARLLAAVADTQAALAASASLELRVAAGGAALDDVFGDHDRLLQVFDNLIGNAAKFTRAGGRITIGAGARARDVVFWVRDTGPGIAAGELPHVFDRFWQGHGDRRGVGLGLAIAQGIVEAHGGQIWVESAPGQGSTFYFTVPAAPGAMLEGDAGSANELPGPAPAAQ